MAASVWMDTLKASKPRYFDPDTRKAEWVVIADRKNEPYGILGSLYQARHAAMLVRRSGITPWGGPFDRALNLVAGGGGSKPG